MTPELQRFLKDTLGPSAPSEPPPEYVFKVDFYNRAREAAKTCRPWSPSYPGEQPPF